MEDEAPARPSVAELAGRFKGSTPAKDAAGQETEKPVRRRPPRSLQLPQTQGDEQEPTGVTSPLPPKAKRNSALIEKLQANLVLSPTALMPSPKSPGFRLLPPVFPVASPGSGSAPVSMVTTPTTPSTVTSVAASPQTEEGPSSFEDPPTAVEGAILPNINKGRARHSIRRRPPSRRHRRTSSGDDIDNANDGGETGQSLGCETEDKTPGSGGRGGVEEENKTDEVKEETTDAPTEKKSNEEEKKETEAEPKEEEEEKEGKGETGLTEGGVSSSEKREEEEKENEKEEKKETENEGDGEKNSEAKQEEAERATDTQSREEETSEETESQTSS